MDPKSAHTPLKLPPLRCLALDDEDHALDLIQLYCAKSEGVELTKRSKDPMEVLQWLNEEAFDVIFLDIQMPVLTGLQLLDLIERPFQVILTSAYPEYALDGYRYKVADYLLKPFSYDRFCQAVALARENLTSKAAAPSEASLHAAPTEGTTPDASQEHIMLKTDGKNHFHKLAFSELRMVEGLRNYAAYHLVPGKVAGNRVVTLSTMADAEALLPSDRFMRIHRSWIVNLKRIERVEGNSLVLDGERLPVGKTYRKAVFERLGLHG